ncbi:MAG TPA: cyclic nucleotide-binding domain-containing protein, partial [Pseudomonadales bacterium]
YARVLDVPAGRWLLQQGRRLTGHHYLLRGSVRTWSPDAVLEAGDPAALRPLCPGPLAVRTESGCRLLQIPQPVLDLAVLRMDPELITVTESDACWQTRFLQSHLMTALPPISWQRILSRLRPESFSAGGWVLREGADTADHCCILACGSALVSRGGETLAELFPGDLFGEDALIAGVPRNASVRMVEPGIVMRLHAGDFSRFLVDVLAECGCRAPVESDLRSTVLLRVTSAHRLRERLARLAADQIYLVSSPSEPVLALTLFLLRKRGIGAWAADPG